LSTARKRYWGGEEFKNFQEEFREWVGREEKKREASSSVCYFCDVVAIIKQQQRKIKRLPPEKIERYRKKIGFGPAQRKEKPERPPDLKTSFKLFRTKEIVDRI